MKDLSDLTQEVSVFVASNVSVLKTDGIRLRKGCVADEILDELVEGAVSRLMYPAYK